MSDNNAQKGLTGPFQSNGYPNVYYVYDQAGNQIVPSHDVLSAGTATEVVIEDEEKDVPEPALSP